MGVMTVSSQNFMEIDMPGWWLSGASVDLDFRNSRYYDSSNILAGLSNLLSISRASIGYAKTSGGLLTQFSTGVMRITDLGLLIEDARTNLLIASQTLDNTSWWSATRCTVTADQTAAPDGTTTADKLAATGTVNAFIIDQGSNNFALGTNTATMSAYYKAGSGASWCAMQLGDGANSFGSYFNLATRLAGNATNGLNTGTGILDGTAVEALANGWYRFSITGHIPSVGGNVSPVCYICCTGDNQTATTGGDFQYVWGIQAELASFPSSYIPTSATSATRAADAVTFVGNAATILNSAPVSALVEVQELATIDAGVFGKNAIVTGAATMAFAAGAPTTVQSGLNTGTVVTLGNSKTMTDNVKIAAAWDGANDSVVGAGGTVRTDTVAFAGLTAMTLGGAVLGYPGGYAYFKRFALWTSKLADVTLQALTRP
jgi:hypothetical protein